MPDYKIKGIPVSFPFEPYPVQTAYMEKVIECLQSGTNGILESPTGTGKTLSLLCSTLGWLMVKKAQVQSQALTGPLGVLEKLNNVGMQRKFEPNKKGIQYTEMGDTLGNIVGEGAMWGTPKIIYASRTHSQLSQAMQELKRTNYSHLKASILGSRDQLCINPDVMKESNNADKTHMCHAKVLSKSCNFYYKLDEKKEHPLLKEQPVLDIEDLVKVGHKIRACPYYLSRQLRSEADIVFMPYNYLLDPKLRRANKIELHNTVIILDEAHNVERMCEESASIQIRNTDLAICIEEITKVMRYMSENNDIDMGNDTPKDFTADDLADLKELLMALEKSFDLIPVKEGSEGSTYPGGYIFEVLEKANITQTNFSPISALLDSLVQFLSTVNNAALAHKGAGLQLISDLFRIAFISDQPDHKDQVKKCYKVHMEIEDSNRSFQSRTSDNWLSKQTANKTAVKILSYWCFSPGFGMKQLLDKDVRCIILTSGTLAPLKPLITELGIPIDIQLESPHIVGPSQIHIRIIPNGPDKQLLSSSYENRNKPEYIESLGKTLWSLSGVIPGGLLVFFPSYPVMAKCQDSWQASGLWQKMCQRKPIFVEPRNKEAFNNAMSDYYERINCPSSQGAMFMAVCRGKVSEGLDFADINGRAVIITGLPFPPLKDPRVILKKRYLEENRTKLNQFLSGDEWYSLEATRAVNQAIGRVIRHRHDYGAILLCDSRFCNPRLKNQLSKWLLGQVKVADNFGPVIGELCRFFRNAERTLPQPNLKALLPSIPQINMNDREEDNSIVPAMFDMPTSRPVTAILPVAQIKTEYGRANDVTTCWNPTDYKYISSGSKLNNEGSLLDRLDQETKAIDFNDFNYVQIKPELPNQQPAVKKRRLKIQPSFMEPEAQSATVGGLALERTGVKLEVDKPKIPETRMDFLILVKKSLDVPLYGAFLQAITAYQHHNSYEPLLSSLEAIFLDKPHLHYLFKGLTRFMKEDHKALFQSYWERFHIKE